MSETAVRVVVADDQTVVREGLRAMLGYLPGIEVVAVADSAEAALDAVAAHDPDVLLTDLRMPGIGGVEGIRRLRAAGSRTGAVALTTFDDEQTIREAITAGALGFLNKDADPATIADAIRTAAAGRSLLDATVLAALTGAGAGAPTGTAVAPGDPAPGGGDGTATRPGAPASDPTSPSSAASSTGSVRGPGAGISGTGRDDAALTPRELDVLRLVAAGRSNQQIARELFVSPATVKTHINHLLAKTQCANRADLVRYAYDHDLRD